MGSPCRTPIRVKVRNISWALFTERNRKHLKLGTLQSLFNNKFHEFNCFLTKNLMDVCEIEVSSPTMPCWRVNTRLRLKGQNQDWFWLNRKMVLSSNNWWTTLLSFEWLDILNYIRCSSALFMDAYQLVLWNIMYFLVTIFQGSCQRCLWFSVFCCCLEDLVVWYMVMWQTSRN